MQLCTGSPSTSTVQAPQSPASHPFFTPNHPSSRRNVRRHCPGRGTAAWLFPFTEKSFEPFPGELLANLFGKLQCHVPTPCRRAVNVVVVMLDLGFEPLAQCVTRRQAWKRQPDRTRRGRRDGESERTVVRRQCPNQQCGRAAKRRERDLPKGGAPAQRRQRQRDGAKQFARQPARCVAAPIQNR